MRERLLVRRKNSCYQIALATTGGGAGTVASPKCILPEWKVRNPPFFVPDADNRRFKPRRVLAHKRLSFQQRHAPTGEWHYPKEKLWQLNAPQKNPLPDQIQKNPPKRIAHAKFSGAVRASRVRAANKVNVATRNGRINVRSTTRANAARAAGEANDTKPIVPARNGPIESRQARNDAGACNRKRDLNRSRRGDFQNESGGAGLLLSNNPFVIRHSSFSQLVLAARHSAQKVWVSSHRLLLLREGLLKFSSILSVSIWGRRGQGKSTAAISRRSN
ncbi:MAG: hypothetical protein QOF48_2348 [Verrucomicrobiota bacterium]